MESIGHLFVLSGPSGAGKSSLRERVLRIFPEVGYSVSHTTRPPRDGEIEGKDYHFVSAKTFRAMREAGVFVEWAEVHGNYYGTSREQLANHLRERRDLLLEIDVQGACQVKACFPHACFIFVLPPNRDTLERRLQFRGTELQEDVKSRLENASKELLEAPWYDYLIINDVLEQAVEALAAIIRATRFRREAVLPQLMNLLQTE